VGRRPGAADPVPGRRPGPGRGPPPARPVPDPPEPPGLHRPAQPARLPLAGVPHAADAPRNQLREPRAGPVRLAPPRHPGAGHGAGQRRGPRPGRGGGAGGHRRPEGRRERDRLAVRPAHARRGRAARRGPDRGRRAGGRPGRDRRPRPHPRAVGQLLQLGPRHAEPGQGHRPRGRPAAGEPPAVCPTPAGERHGRGVRPRRPPGADPREGQPLAGRLVQRRRPAGGADIRPAPLPVRPADVHLPPAARRRGGRPVEGQRGRPACRDRDRGREVEAAARGRREHRRHDFRSARAGQPGRDGGHPPGGAAVRVHRGHGADGGRPALGPGGRAPRRRPAEAAAGRVVRPARRREPHRRPRHHTPGGHPDARLPPPAAGDRGRRPGRGG